MALEAINSTTYKADKHGEIKSNIKIGSDDITKFKHEIYSSFHDGEFYLKFSNRNRNKIVTDEIASLSNGKISQTIDGETDEYYLDGDRLKCDTIYYSKPKKLDLEYDLEYTEGIEFLYQDTLYNDWLNDLSGIYLTYSDYAAHHERPLDVEGSFAVYCNKKDHVVGQTNYLTGKLLHIYNIKLTDAEGKVKYVKWNPIKNKKLTTTLPEDFFDSAIYPIKQDPDFGYTSIGASADYWISSIACKATSNPVSDGSLDSISMHCKINAGTPYFKAGIYDDSSGVPYNRLGYNDTGVIVGSTYDWITCPVTYAGITASTQYWLVYNGNADNILFHYDSTGGPNELSLSGYVWPDPFNISPSQQERVSIYATYTASGGGGEKPHQYYQQQLGGAQ